MITLSPFSTQNEVAVQRWLDTLDTPVSFTARSPQEAIRMCWGASGLPLSAGSMGDALYSLGHRITQVKSIPDPGGSDRPLPQFRVRVGGLGHAEN